MLLTQICHTHTHTHKQTLKHTLYNTSTPSVSCPLRCCHICQRVSGEQLIMRADGPSLCGLLVCVSSCALRCQFMSDATVRSHRCRLLSCLTGCGRAAGPYEPDINHWSHRPLFVFREQSWLYFLMWDGCIQPICLWVLKRSTVSINREKRSIALVFTVICIMLSELKQEGSLLKGPSYQHKQILLTSG